MPHEADITIIGAGIVGLAIAAEVASEDKNVFVLEKNSSFGLETSSRNSQVIHSGIYYPKNSLKAKACVEGNALLYELCSKQGIPHRRLGKLIVAIDEEETDQLRTLLIRGRGNGVEGLSILSTQDIRRIEPNINAVAALFAPTTGIVDALALMQHFIAKAKSKGTKIVYKSEVTSIEKKAYGYRVSVYDRNGGFSFNTKILVNSAGLCSDKVAKIAGIDIDQAGYRIHYCKGEYFRMCQHKSKLIKRLVYPVPLTKASGLGIHATPDLDGAMLLGPNSKYIDCIDYSVDISQKEAFYQSAVKFLPFIQCDDLEPEMAGIRPTLQRAGDSFKDFVMRDESDKGLPGFINLVGIESPGLTSSPYIAKYVGNMVNEALKN